MYSSGYWKPVLVTSSEYTLCRAVFVDVTSSDIGMCLECDVQSSLAITDSLAVNIHASNPANTHAAFYIRKAALSVASLCILNARSGSAAAFSADDQTYGSLNQTTVALCIIPEPAIQSQNLFSLLSSKTFHISHFNATSNHLYWKAAGLRLTTTYESTVNWSIFSKLVNQYSVIECYQPIQLDHVEVVGCEYNRDLIYGNVLSTTKPGISTFRNSVFASNTRHITEDNTDTRMLFYSCEFADCVFDKASSACDGVTEIGTNTFNLLTSIALGDDALILCTVPSKRFTQSKMYGNHNFLFACQLLL